MLTEFFLLRFFFSFSDEVTEKNRPFMAELSLQK
jgi:hypothetical protein